jgi:hypothetical protein
MSSSEEILAASVTPPRQGKINVINISTTPSAAIALPTKAPTGAFLQARSDVKWYVIFGDANVDAPDETATSGDQRCWEITADEEWHRFVSNGDTHFRVKGSATGVLRYLLG